MRKTASNGRHYTLAAALIALVVASACGDSGGGGEVYAPVDVTFMVANPVINLGHVHLAVAQEEGLYEAGGVAVDYLTSDGTVATMQALATGNADMGQVDTQALMSGQDQGIDNVQAVCTYVASNIYNIIVLADSDVESVADLQGARIGVQSLGTGVYYNARVMLEEAGLDPDEDVEFVTIEGPPALLQAMEAGNLEAVGSIDVNIGTYENTGASMRTFQATGPMQWQWNLVAATTEFIEEHPEAVAAVCRAIQEAQMVVVGAPDLAIDAFDTWGGDLGTLTEEQNTNIMMGRAEAGFRTYPEGDDRWGWYNIDAMDELAQVYLDLALIDGDPDLVSLFTEQFFDEIQPDEDRVDAVIAGS